MNSCKAPINKFQKLFLTIALVSVVFALPACLAEKSKLQPKAREGVLDLSQWDFETDGIVELSGYWELYWNQFFPPEPLTGDNLYKMTDYIEVPTYWNHLAKRGERLPGHGFATYRLRVHLPSATDRIWFKISDMSTAYDLYVNGSKIASNGVVGKTEDTMTPTQRPLIAHYLPNGNQMEIVLHISNFHYRNGGTWKKIRVGNENDIKRLWLQDVSQGIFVFSSLLMIGLYHIAFYFIRKRELTSQLYFGLFCLLLATRIVFTGDRICMSLFPAMPFELLTKLEYLTFYLGPPLFITYVTQLFNKHYSFFILKIVQIVAGLFSLIVIFTPTRIFNTSLYAYQIFVLIVCFYCIWCLCRAAISKEEGARILLIGCLVFFLAVVNDMFSYSFHLGVYDLSTFGFLFFILAQAYMFSIKYSNAFDLIATQKVDLTKAVDEARIANEAKSLFLANMSHELKTPMNGILGMNNLLLETELKKDQQDFALTIKKSSKHLLRLINDLLDFSKLEQGKLTLRKIDFDFRIMLADCIKNLSLKARKKNLEFYCIVHHEIPLFLYGDPGRLKQILFNIIDNAIKFTTAGHVIIKINFQGENDKKIKLHFEIEDTGIGIDANYAESIFDSFSQVDASDSRHYDGAGLGLPLTKQLVDMMKGRIEFTSEKNQGTKFQFTIEFDKSKEKNKDCVNEINDIKGKKILTLDAETLSRKALTEQLQLLQCLVTSATDENSAYLKISDDSETRNAFDAVILDTNISRNQIELIGEKLSSDKYWSTLPVLVISSSGIRGDVEWLNQYGFSAYLSKPVQYLEMRDCLKTILNKEFDKTEIVTNYSLKEERKRNIEILVAEDNVVNQKLMLSFLKKLGYSAIAVKDGKEAVEALEKHAYDLVFMDVRMPHMDGIEATKIIRDPVSQVKYHDVVVIAVTAHAKKEDCLNAGMNGYLAKPIKKEDLRHVIEKQLFDATDKSIKYV